MTQRIPKLAPLAALLLLLAGAGVAAPARAAQTFEIDPAHSEVTFQIRHFLNKVRGNFRQFDAKIVKDDQDPANSSVEFTIQTASIDTGVERRDNHLRSADFFDAEKYPTITFQSSAVEKVSDTDYKVTGRLTMRGVTKVITLPVTYLGEMKDAFGHTRAGFTTETTLNRQDFGVSWNKELDGGGYMLGDDVDVSISFEAVLQ
jgi:polyisoprenoid-binding protein YceI